MGDGALPRPPVRRDGGAGQALRCGAAGVHAVPQESLLFQLDRSTSCLHLERGK